MHPFFVSMFEFTAASSRSCVSGGHANTTLVPGADPRIFEQSLGETSLLS